MTRLFGQHGPRAGRAGGARRQRGTRAGRAGGRRGRAPGAHGGGRAPVHAVRALRPAQQAVPSRGSLGGGHRSGQHGGQHPPQDHALQPRQAPRVHRGRQRRYIGVRGERQSRGGGACSNYVGGAADPKLTKWWARYCESVGEFEKALGAYQAARDFLSLVRVYCAQGDFAVAAEIVEESHDAAAAFHLARTFEAQDATAEAVGGGTARTRGAAGAHRGDGRRAHEPGVAVAAGYDVG